MTEKNIHGGHRKRLRERAMAEGLDSFNPHQVIELLLFYALPRQDTSEIAHRLINQFGSVGAVLNAPTGELIKVPGVGNKVAQWLHNIGDVVDTYCDIRTIDRPAIINLKSALDFCEGRRGHCLINTCYQICTVPSGTIQVYTQICDSLDWGNSDVLRRGIHEVLAVKARNVFIVEFVEEDIPVPAEYDRLSAERYASTLSTIGAELIDVILVGRSDLVSLYRIGVYEREKFSNARSVVSAYYLQEDPVQRFNEENLPDFDSGI